MEPNESCQALEAEIRAVKFGYDGIGGWRGMRQGHKRSHRSWPGMFQFPGLVTAALDRNDNGIFIIP